MVVLAKAALTNLELGKRTLKQRAVETRDALRRESVVAQIQNLQVLAASFDKAAEQRMHSSTLDEIPAQTQRG